MAQQLVRGGAPIDIPSTAEIGDVVAERARQVWVEQSAIAEAREREHARGIKALRRDTAVVPAATSRFTNLDGIAPSLGYVWAVRLLAAQLASAGTFQAFITSDTDTTKGAATQRRLVASGASNQYQVITFNSGACVLQPDEGLFLVAGQNIISYFVAGWEVPAEMAWKLL